MEGAVYQGYNQQELDRAYTQTEWASNVAALMAEWQARGEACRAAFEGYRELAYGTSEAERIDVFPADGRLVHFHIHGGAWKSQSKADCSFMAPAMAREGVTLAVPDFGLLPETRMPDVLDQIARALRFTYERLVDDGPADTIVVSGHSSGAHMAAMLALKGVAPDVPDDAIRAVVCISGSYDLEPVLLSARRSYIDLTAEEAKALSPIRRVDELRLPLHLVYGEHESPEFKRQARAFAAEAERCGKLAALREFAATNHFEIADGLADPHSDVGRYVFRLMSRVTSQPN